MGHVRDGGQDLDWVIYGTSFAGAEAGAACRQDRPHRPIPHLNCQKLRELPGLPAPTTTTPCPKDQELGLNVSGSGSAGDRPWEPRLAEATRTPGRCQANAFVLESGLQDSAWQNPWQDVGSTQVM